MKKTKFDIKLYGKIALFTLIVHWLLLLVAYQFLKETGGTQVGFIATVYNKLKDAGDIPHYINIAKHWYSTTGEHQNDIVFFPLFPVLLKVFQVVLRDYILAGCVVSILCLIVGNIYLYLLLNEEYDETRAWEGVMLLNVFPVSFFFVGVFTESVFIMLSVMCLYYIRKKKWIVVGVVGMLAALSRSQGIALLVPALYELCITMKEPKQRKWSGAAVSLIPLGTGIYFLMNQVIYGSWNKFMEYQAAEPWYNTSHWIASNLKQHYDMALGNPGLAVFIYWAQIGLYFGSMILLFVAYKNKLKTAYIAYSGAYLFMTYLHGWMISGPRYIMGCVGLFILFAGVKNDAVRRGAIIVSSLLAVIFSLWFLQGQAIM